MYRGDEARNKLETLLAFYQQLEKQTQAIVDLEESASTGGADVRFNLPDGWLNNSGSRTDGSKYWNQQANFGKLVDVAIDTTVAALALDRTRVSCMQFSATGTNKGPVGKGHYGTLGIQGLEGNNLHDHHFGHDPNQVRRRNQARVFRWYYSKLAQLINKLKSIPDGTGTLFDSTLIITASEFGMYNHRNNDIPYIVAAGSDFNIRKGQYQDLASGNTSFRYHGDLFLGAARALGTNLNKFGNSTNAFTL